MPDRNFTVRLSARVDAYVSAIKQAERETHNFSRTSQRNMSRIGTQMQSFGRMTTVAVTIPLLATGAAAVKAGVDWESAFTGVRKTVDGTATQIARLESELRGMAERMPASHTEIAAVAEAAGQLGIKVDDVAEFAEVMIKLGDTTNVVGQEGAINMARFMNIMQTAPSRINELGATLVHLGNNTATTEAEILELTTRIAGAGKIAGLSEADVMALAAAITSVGVHAEAGGTATSKMLLMMSDAVQMGGAKLQTLADVAGVSMGEFSRLFREDAAHAFAMFISGLKGIADSGQAVTPIFAELGVADERLMRAMRDTANAGPLLANALDLANTAAAEGTALNEEAAKRYETTASKMAMFRNKLVELGIDLSEVLIPMLEAAMRAAGGMIDGFAAIPRPIQAVIMALAGLVAVAGPAIWILGTLIRNLQTLIAVVRQVSLSTLATGFGAVLVAASAVAATFYVFQQRSRAAAEAVREQEQAIADLTKRLNESPEPIEVLIQAFEDLASEDGVLRDAMLDTGITFEDLANTAAAGAAEFSVLKGRLVDSAEAAGMSKDEAYAFGQALEAQRVTMISAYQAAEDMQTIQYGVAGATGEATDEIELQSEAEEAAAAAAKAHADALDATIDKLEEERDALQESLEALQDKLDASRAAVDATFALHDAEDSFIDAVAELNEVLADGESSLRDIQQAQDAVAESARDVADGHVRVAEEQATLAGTTLSATERLDIFNESLIEQAANAEGPVRDSIIKYIAAVNGIPENQATYIAALIEEGRLEDAELALQFVSRPRKTSIEADATQSSLNATENKLAWLTRKRSVYVDFTGPGGAVGAGRFLDAGGFGRPGDIVAERGPELVDGRIVMFPTMLTKPANVTGRQETARILEGRDADRFQRTGDASTLRPMPFQSAPTTTLGEPVFVEIAAPSTMTLNVDGQSMTAHVEQVVYERERREAGRR